MELYSAVARSNQFTMRVASKDDHRQDLPDKYRMPDPRTRRLRAQLILEEAMETVHALGFKVNCGGWVLVDDSEPDLLEIIDGCCDTIYVATGCILSCGAPDLPHLTEVCSANDRKFPGGKAIISETGKYLKPDGWRGPDHAAVMQAVVNRDKRQDESDKE